MAFNDSLQSAKEQMQTYSLMSARTMSLSTASEVATVEETETAYQRMSNYPWYDDYSDEKYSVIDESKNITIDESQINITQEENSQFIPFEMPRYYDGFDLTKTELVIRFETSDGAKGSSTPVNVTYNNKKIRFAWLVNFSVTRVAGKIKLEIHAIGTNSKGEPYHWKSRPNESFNVLQSWFDDKDDIVLDGSWVSELVERVAANVAEQIANAQIGNQVEEAKTAAEEAKTAAANAEASVENALVGYATQEFVQEEISKIDVTDQLGDYALKSEIPTVPTNISEFNNDIGYLTEHQDLSNYATETYVQEEIKKIDVTEQLGDYALKTEIPSLEGYATETFVQEEIAKVDVSDQLVDYAKTTEVDNKISSLRTDIDTNTENIQTINGAITTINHTLESIDKSPNNFYVTTYNEPYSIEGNSYTGENTLVLYKTDETDSEGSRTVVSAHVITGGSGGSTSANTIKIERVTASPLVVTEEDKVVIEYNFIGTDASGEDIGQGKATWKLGNKVIKNETIYTGANSVDLTEYLNVGSDQKITLIITDDIGTAQQKIWYVSVVDVRLESTFDDTRKYTANEPVSFTYTPYGAVEKIVHFLLDGEEIDTVVSSKAAAGLSASYIVPAHEHGTHLLEAYMTTTINGNEIESNHIFKDIIWFDEESDVAVIGCVNQEFTARQYEATNITYTVIDPSTETPSVNLKAVYTDENGEIVEEYNSNLVLSTSTNVWSYKTAIIGVHTLTITCGEIVKTLTATIEELGIEISPTTTGLEFDFNPVGYSNDDENRVWYDAKTGVTMTLSDNFDWVNGGYQIDEAGDQYFCVKAGTTATINYNLFADDAKAVGKEFKVIFKTTNVKNRNTSFISCMNEGIGLDMLVESANIYSSNGSLYSPYCEEDVIEFDFNINQNTGVPMVMTYEDGLGFRPMIYTSDSSFWQVTPQPITIGCDNCDVHIYRMKAYSTSLSDKDILNNFIADARSAEEMIRRYNKNQIYKEGVLDPEYLAEMCPDLRIIMIDAPWFTNDKDNKIDDTNITMIYKNGDPILDNWTCTGARHRGQGTSSNEYGYASRNIDLVMDTSTSLFTLGDGQTTASTITLTRTSVPTDYLNIKVNVASSECENNAQMARNYNEFNPFIRFARWKDSKVKDCMEFYNCVVFIKERNEDISTHREFNDTNWHFYSIGNVGDSKKTDDTRVNNKKDPLECIVEITDYNVPLAEWPTGVEGICPEEQWVAGNAAYDLLYSEYEYEDGEFKSFGAKSYEFRYEMKNITDEQRQVNIDNWREMYKFVVTSSDEEFYSKLKEWFVVDSVLYYYLFTERYTMVDNRAKNSFWHYGKVYISTEEATTLGEDAGGYIIDNEQASIRNGYRWDLTAFYDADTSLGIGNTGKLNIPYGKEDTDYYIDGDSSSSYIFRAAESKFFCRVRDLFKSEMQAMFVDRENVNAWSSSRLIKQWDDAQNQFPEELWRLNFQRLYIRTWQGISIDNSIAREANPRFLEEMMNGRKKYQRRMFERNQELYMATKYFGKVATQDQIMMRFNNPVNAVIKPDFTLYITPYSDMYIGTSFGNVTPTNFRAKAGVEYTIPCSIESGTADITLIYGASFIQAIGDLSKCYVGDNDFSKASRLQRLVIGSDVEGYTNTFMTKISLGNNKLLEYLDIRKIIGLNSVVDLSQCGNLVELHAEGSGATGVIFANGGKLEKAYIPAITSLTMKNLNYLNEFVIESYDKLQTLVIEYTPFIDTYNIVTSTDILKVLRLIGIDWKLENTDILQRLLTLRGINNTGGEINMSVLAGDIFVPIIKQQELRNYNEAWPDANITYNTFVEQFAVTFKNTDGTILEVQYVDKGGDAIDPLTREENPISTPTIPSSVSHDFTFAGWDGVLTGVFSDRVITATYTESLREYTIIYKAMDTVLQTSTGLYGDNVPYTGDTPVYTAEESGYVYYMFNRWDKSGFIDGDKTVNAIFDRFEYTSTSFDGKELADLTPVEIYAMNKLGLAEEVVTNKDPYTIVVGNDIDYDDIESTLLISEKTYFNGTNYIDTGIQLFDEDKDFVLAVDYEFLSGNTANSVLMQCFQANGTNGFKLWYSNSSDFTGVKLTWGTTSDNVVSVNKREVIVIRHKKGDNNLTIYKSNLDADNVLTANLTRTKATVGTGSLVFGCARADDGIYENYGIGNIYWAKLWYADLGDEVCQSLAMWTHESITLEACGFRKYYLTNNTSKRCSFSLLASHLLGRTKKWNSSNTNTGGWASSTLNKSLNNRLYNAMPTQIKALMQQVIVYSSIGGMSSELSSSNCYITIPAAIEVDSSMTSEPYNSEGIAIPYLSTNTSRKRAFDNGDYNAYWLRSPNVSYANYIWRVDENGQMQGITNASTSLGILIEISF